ncbi:triosephosphate isomerase (TIM) [Methylophilaceae bacterium]|nr:triosephosphate isomerase (TIM) [Methylophilaceae bacterium]
MHGNLAKNQALLTSLIANLHGLQRVDVAICVPFPYLYQAQLLLTGTNIYWGAQNVSQFEEGAFTGSISAQMIADFNCRFAIIGHSERRALSHESYTSAANRFMQLLKARVTPVFCVGETYAEREAGSAEAIVGKQMHAVLDDMGEEWLAQAIELEAVFSYEPVWAIGTGKNATPGQAQDMHAFIRSLIAERDPDFAARARILYGGSVNASNAAEIFSMPDIDGGLIGRCSLDAEGFRQICEAAAQQAEVLA